MSKLLAAPSHDLSKGHGIDTLQNVNRGCALRALTSLPKKEFYDVVFIIGPHKSGTSLLTEFVAKDFFDPSRVTNAHERGYGQSVARYLTRECQIARWINVRCGIPSGWGIHSSERFSDSRAVHLITWYLKMWPQPFVVKSPTFAYSLHIWLRSARQLGLRACACFTRRNHHDLRVAWTGAPFTRKLGPHSILPALLQHIEWQKHYTQSRLGIPARVFDYQDLRELLHLTGAPKEFIDFPAAIPQYS